MDNKLHVTLLLMLIPTTFLFSQIPNADSPKTTSQRDSTPYPGHKQLKEVYVTGRKPLVQMKGDKIIYNASSDISNKSGTAADVLRKAPMVTVDPAGNVKMRGSSGIKVLLNGIPSGIMARNLKDALRMIPASSIEAVEIITNPPAKYDAAGAGGVINIITKKKVVKTSGYLDLSAGNLERSIGGELTVSRKKFSIDLSAGVSKETIINVWDIDRRGVEAGRVTDKLLQHTDVTELSKSLYGDLSAEYRSDSTQMLGIGFSYWDGTFPSKSSFYNKRYKNNQPVSEYMQQSDQLMKFGSSDLSVTYHKQLCQTGQSLQLLGQYSHTFDNSSYTTKQSYLSELARNHSNNNDFSFQADYAHPLDKSGKQLLEIGTKYSNVKGRSTYKVFNNGPAVDSTNFIEDADRSNVMDYYQHTLAAYISVTFSTKNKWTIRPGIRYENTNIGSRFHNGAPTFTASFNNFFPNMLVLRQLNDQHTLKFNFSQRIRRPEIWDVNPFINASDPQNRTSGNSGLQPEIARLLELGHDYNANSGFTLNSSIYFSRSNNAIESLGSIDDKGISTTSAQNIASIQRVGSNVNAALQPTNELSITGGVEFYKVRFKSDVLALNNSGFYYAANINVIYEFPRDLTINLYGDYNKGDITLQGYNSSYYTCKLSVQKELMNKKASFTLGISNPFQKHLQQRNYMVTSAFSSSQTNRFYNRSVVLSFNWRFGGKSKEDRKNGKELENDRALPHGKKKG